MTRDATRCYECASVRHAKARAEAILARPVTPGGAVARKVKPCRAEGAGTVRQLPSGKWQARWRPEPGAPQVSAPQTFWTKQDAEGWLDAFGDRPPPQPHSDV